MAGFDHTYSTNQLNFRLWTPSCGYNCVKHFVKRFVTFPLKNNIFHISR